MDEIAAGGLKCLAAWSPGRSLASLVEQALRRHIRDQDIRRLFDEVYLLYTDEPAAAVRSWLAPHLEEGESVFVAEFESWSGHGPAPDRRWLLRRGH